MYRARGYYNRFRGSDRMTQLIAGVAFILLLIIALPRFIPGTASGIDCNGLPIPRISGSSQSLLASQVDPSVLHLELVPNQIVVTQGAPLVMDLRYINESMAPLTLFYDPSQITFRYMDQDVGLIFSITTPDGRALGVPPNVRPPFPVRQQFAANQLRILGPRQRCTQRVEIDVATLSAAQMGPGDYRITAVYRNPSKGVLPPVGPLTPTPIFRDQGVWTGQVQSNDIRVTIVQPGQVAPAQ